MDNWPNFILNSSFYDSKSKIKILDSKETEYLLF
jgi:hypothetical protein